MKKKVIKYLICFFIPIIIFNICLVLNDIAPLGKNIITVYDSSYQYPAFFYGLKNFNFFSFGLGLGFNYLGTFMYYLVNPLNWLIKLFDLTSYNTFYYIILSIKFGLCGITMQYFLSSEEKHDNLFSCILSIAYALSGFISTYYYNTFWIDGVIMLPLILKGINNIVDNKKPLFFIISLSISIILCFYTGYMSGIFSCIYFIYKIIEKKKYKDKKIWFKFLFSTILACLISTVVLLPSFYTLIGGKSQGFSDPFTTYFKFNKNIRYLFYSFIPGNYHASQVSYGYAQNFCTLFVLVLVIFSFFNKNIKLRTKIITGIILLYYILSYSFNLFDFSWQFFQKPVWWQHRYSFTLSCFMIIIAYKNIMNFKSFELHPIIKTFVAVLLTLLIVIGFIFLNKEYNITENRMFIIIFAVLILINYIYLFNPNHKYKYVIIILIMVELILNLFINVKQNNISGSLELDNFSKQYALSNVEAMQKYDGSFYRSELINPISSNDGLLFGYNGINYFNSLRNQNVINLSENNLNMIVDSHCSIKIKSYDPYLMSLFNIKYFIGKTDLYYYQNINDTLQQNPYPLSTAFLVNENIKNIKLTDNFHNNIELIYGSMINEDLKLYDYLDVDIKLNNAKYDAKTNRYDKIDSSKEADITLNYTAKENIFIIPQYYYVKSHSTLYINGIEKPINSSYIYLEKGNTLSLKNEMVQNNEQIEIVKLKYLKEKVYKHVMETLYNNNSFNEIKVNEKHLYETNIDVIDNKYNYLFTSIPYENGMIIKVNGKKVKHDLILDTFIGIKLNKEKNNITIDYTPKGLIPGILISLGAILVTIVYNKRSK